MASISALILITIICLVLYHLFDSPMALLDAEDEKKPSVEFVDSIYIKEDPENELLFSQIKELIKQPHHCENSQDCLKISYGCPFGCSSLVNKENHQKIKTMIKKWAHSRSSSCSYVCPEELSKAVCINNICSLDYEQYNKMHIKKFVEDNFK